MTVRALLETALPILEEANRYTANNIANVDTVGFEPQQVDFQATLKSALGRGAGRIPLATTNGKHLPARQAVRGLVVIPSKFATHRTDGNKVSLDYEMTQLSRNNFNTLTRLLNSQNRLLREVLRAR